MSNEAPKKVVELASQMGVHDECLSSGVTCSDCDDTINTAMFLAYGHATSAEELVEMIKADIQKDKRE